MSTLTCSIGGITNLPVLNASPQDQEQLEVRGQLQITIVDASGVYSFTRGMPVLYSDSSSGIMFTGFVNNDVPQKLSPDTGNTSILHVVTCYDNLYRFDKRTNRTNYTNQYSGDIATDMVINGSLAQEGVTALADIHIDTTTSDFSEGNHTNTMGWSNITGQGDLEIAKAGIDFSLSEDLTADFSTGTLVNMIASNNSLSPTTVNALKMQSTLSFSYGTEFANSNQTSVISPVNGSASGTIQTSGSIVASGNVYISGGTGGESATFYGNYSNFNTFDFNSLPISATATGSLSPTYVPKNVSKVKVDATHYRVITTDEAVNDNRVDAIIWTGSFTVAAHDSLVYDIWIGSTSPSYQAGVDLYFSDGSILTEYLGSLKTNTDVGVWDQNGASVAPTQDLSDFVKDTWYHRVIDLTILSGKVIQKVSLFNSGNNAGTYDVYVKNCYLNSQFGSPFFGVAQTVPTVNPPTLSSIGAYITGATLTTVVAVYDPAISYRVSAAHSLDSIKLVKNSLITWVAANPIIGPTVVPNSLGVAAVAGNENILISYDGVTWLKCTNNGTLPGLPSGANVAGIALYLKETFTGGQDPTAIPSLQQVEIVINSAPSATTTDVTALFGNTSEWNSGVKQGVGPNVNGNLALAMTTHTWSNLSGMTFISGDLTDLDVTIPVQSVSGGAYAITSSSDSDGVTWSSTRFNFISAAQNFTIDGDFTMNGFTNPAQNEVGFLYRQTYWGSPNNSFAYYVRIMQANGVGSITLGYGVNSPPASGVADPTTSGPYTPLLFVAKTITNNVTYHVKVVVSGNRHTIYWNNETTPSIDLLDNTYTQPGNIGIRTLVFTGNTGSNPISKIANFTVTNTFAGIWTSPSINLSALGTCGNTQIAWSEITASGVPQSTAIVISSLDGGSTWQQCTNGSSIIPGLSVGTNVSGKSLLVQIILSSTGHLLSPIISGLYVRVCGAYPGSSGTRDTTPLGNDTMVRSNSSGSWGTAFDTQTYTKVGTGTIAVTSNEATITNTTGDVHMILGSRTWSDEDATVRFSLSSTGITGGIELRYVDTNNFYRLAFSTTSLSIVKVRGGGVATLAATSETLSINTYYRARFRIVSFGLANLYGRIWIDGTLEPTTWNITGLG